MIFEYRATDARELKPTIAADRTFSPFSVCAALCTFEAMSVIVFLQATQTLSFQDKRD